MKRLPALLVALLSLTLISEVSMAACPDLLNHQMNNLDGKPLDLCAFSGKVVLAVNTASYCGNTPQYKAWKRSTRSTRTRAWSWSASRPMISARRSRAAARRSRISAN